MSTATKEWTFDSDSESWVDNSGDASVTMQWQTSDGDPSSGCLESRITGKNKNNIGSYWELTDTIANIFGIASAATINSMGDNSLDHVHSACTEWNVGDSPYDGAFEIWDNVIPTQVGTFWSDVSFSSTFSWTTTSRTCATVDLSGQSWTGATTIRLRLYNILDTGNDNNAAITLRNDSIRLTVDYTVGAAPGPVDVSDLRGIADVPDLKLSSFISKYDGMAIADDAALLITKYFADRADSATLADVANLLVTQYYVDVADLMGMSDYQLVSAAKAFYDASLSDSTALSDSIGITNVFNVTMEDA